MTVASKVFTPTRFEFAGGSPDAASSLPRGNVRDQDIAAGRRASGHPSSSGAPTRLRYAPLLPTPRPLAQEAAKDAPDRAVRTLRPGRLLSLHLRARPGTHSERLRGDSHDGGQLRARAPPPRFSPTAPGSPEPNQE